MARLDFDIINYQATNNIAVAERADGRVYDVEIYAGRVTDVIAVGVRRRVTVDGTKIGEAIKAKITEMLVDDVPDFFIYDYNGVVEARLFPANG